MPQKPFSRRAASVVTALLLAGAGVLGSSSPAAAHDELLSSYPSAETSVRTSPDEITLTFSAALVDADTPSVIEVVDATGRNVGAGAPGITGASITQHLSPETAAGQYTVTWAVVSSDGHPISGEYSFTVGAAEPAQTAPAGGTPGPSTASPSPSPSATTSAAAPNQNYGGVTSGGGELFPVLTLLAGVVILGGGVIVVLLAGRERRRRDRAAETGSAGDEE